MRRLLARCWRGSCAGISSQLSTAPPECRPRSVESAQAMPGSAWQKMLAKPLMLSVLPALLGIQSARRPLQCPPKLWRSSKPHVETCCWLAANCGRLGPMSQSRHVSADLDNRLAFETLISDLSARLVAATDESFEETIESALRQVTEFFGADRGGIVVVRPGQHWAHVLHAWYAHDFASPIARDFNLADAFPWAYHVLVERCGPHILDSTEDQPPEAERDRANHRAMGVRSTLNIPIVVDAAREVHHQRRIPPTGGALAAVVRASAPAAGSDIREYRRTQTSDRCVAGG